MLTDNLAYLWENKNTAIKWNNYVYSIISFNKIKKALVWPDFASVIGISLELKAQQKYHIYLIWLDIYTYWMSDFCLSDFILKNRAHDLREPQDFKKKTE